MVKMEAGMMEAVLGHQIGCHCMQHNEIPCGEGLQEQVLPFAQSGTPCVANPVNEISS